jgi:hypothetical protein
MGWFDFAGDILGGIGDVGGGDSGGGGFNWSKLIGIGTNVYDAIATPHANKLAAEKVRASQQKAADLRSAGANAGADALVSGYTAAATPYAPVVDAGGAARGRLMQIAAGNPYQLTPEQKIAQEDMQRQLNNRLATQGLRGAGRAGAAVFNDASRRQEAQFFGDNMRRSDTANGTLFNAGNRAIDQTSSLASNVGKARAGAATDSANAQANAEETAGSVEAGSDLASARARGSAIGGIGSLIASDNKSAETRRPRYTPEDYYA